MNSYRSICCALLFSFLAIAIIRNASARKDQGECWTLTREETLIPESEAHQVGACFMANELIKGQEEEIDVLVGSESKGKKEDRSKGFSDDFEPRPNISAYGDDDVGLKGKREEHKHFADDFEPRPDVSAYGDDDVGLREKREEHKRFTEDFEPRSNLSAYGEDEVV